MISVLSNLTTHLEPFLGTHELLFPEKVMQNLLDGLTVKTDVSRVKEHLGNRNLQIVSRMKSLFCFKIFMIWALGDLSPMSMGP